MLVGGVLSMTGQHFKQINGYSNMYWGWGGEDDDIFFRINSTGLRIERPPLSIARYSMLTHKGRMDTGGRVYQLLRKSISRMPHDGINSLAYKLVFVHKHPLYTHIMVNIGAPPENVARELKRKGTS